MCSTRQNISCALVVMLNIGKLLMSLDFNHIQLAFKINKVLPFLQFVMIHILFT